MGREKRYYVYIITNPSRTLYTGITNNLRRRIDEHQRKLVPGFTAKYNINRLVYFDVFEDVRNAIDCEKKVKSWTRAKRVALVDSRNPKWDDLSREWDQLQTFRFAS
jgi:putative endonuclease